MADLRRTSEAIAFRNAQAYVHYKWLCTQEGFMLYGLLMR